MSAPQAAFDSDALRVLAPESALLPEIELTFLISDVVGFSEMTDRLGDREAHRVMQRHHQIVRDALGVYGGEEVELRGDGFYLAFGSPELGLECAVAIQRSLALDELQHPEQPIRVRMGLHSGRVLCDLDTYFGKALIQSSRIAALARGGEILVSSSFKQLVEATADVPFGRGRDVELRGLRGPDRVFSVSWEALNGVYAALVSHFNRPGTVAGPRKWTQAEKSTETAASPTQRPHQIPASP